MAKNFNDSNNRSNGNRGETVGLPEKYLESGYYTDVEKKKMNPDYIVVYAKNIARSLEKEGGNMKNKRTQIRKYYDYCIRVRDKLSRAGNDFSYVEADFAELLPKVSYAKSRSTVTDLFVEFIDKNINAVKDAKDYRAFLKHFESIVAFMKKD